jgi:flagellin-like protein
MFEILKKMYRKRKAVSPVVATLLIIALTVSAAAIVYVIYIRLIRKSSITANVIQIKDSDKDSQYDEITLQIANTGTLVAEIYNFSIWTVPVSLLNNSNYWVEHTDWTFENENDATSNPAEILDVTIITETDQISLSLWEYTYYRLEIFYTGNKNPFVSDWALLNDFADLGDLLVNFDSFNLTALGFEGSIDDPDNNAENNYLTDGSGGYQLTNESVNFLPVLDELELIPFYVSNSLVAFHTDNDPTMDDNPLQQVLNLDSPLRASKFFILGLAGSWGDEFPPSAWALNMTFVYTDGTTEEYLLGHEYIDDWYYTSNQDTSPTGSAECVSVPYGLITEIDLGDQIYDSSPHHIHTHTTRFYFDYFKYIETIIFTDPGTDDSAAHLISITLG